MLHLVDLQYLVNLDQHQNPYHTFVVHRPRILPQYLGPFQTVAVLVLQDPLPLLVELAVVEQIHLGLVLELVDIPVNEYRIPLPSFHSLWLAQTHLGLIWNESHRNLLLRFLELVGLYQLLPPILEYLSLLVELLYPRKDPCRLYTYPVHGA